MLYYTWIECKRAALLASTRSSRQVESLPRYNEEKKQDVSDEKIAQWNVSTYTMTSCICNIWTAGLSAEAGNVSFQAELK